MPTLKIGWKTALAMVPDLQNSAAVLSTARFQSLKEQTILGAAIEVICSLAKWIAKWSLHCFRCLFPSLKQRMMIPQQKGEERLIQIFPSLSPISCLSFGGMALGIVTGFAAKWLQSKSNLAGKNLHLCRLGFTNHSVLQAMNALKQFETKTFAFGIPLLLVGGQIAIHAVSKASKEGISRRFKEAVQLYFPYERKIEAFVLAALSLSNPFYSTTLGLSKKGGFDSSGHVMLKTVLSFFGLRNLSTVARAGGVAVKAFSYLVSSLNMLMDAVFIHHTVSVCHTEKEIMAGLVWGLSISLMAKQVAALFPGRSSIY